VSIRTARNEPHEPRQRENVEGGIVMEMIRMTVFAVFAVFIMISVAFSMQHEASSDKGKVLFNDAKLGTNGKICNDCHKDGAGLEKAAVKNDLEAIVNTCIKKAMNGRKLKKTSVEMQSMVLYIKGLGIEKKPAGKKTPFGC
jgi:hypothetical protein